MDLSSPHAAARPASDGGLVENAAIGGGILRAGKKGRTHLTTAIIMVGGKAEAPHEFLSVVYTTIILLRQQRHKKPQQTNTNQQHDKPRSGCACSDVLEFREFGDICK